MKTFFSFETAQLRNFAEKLHNTNVNVYSLTLLDSIL